MADNLSETSSYWNGRFGNTINLNYTDLLNVEPVDVPYNNIGRVKSFFLQTRGAYIEELISRTIGNFMTDNGDNVITDAKIIRDDDCYEENGKLWLSYLNTHNNEKGITYREIKNGQIQDGVKRYSTFPVDGCTDNKLHVIEYVKNEIEDKVGGGYFYQENSVVDGVVSEGYIGSEVLDKDGFIEYENSEGETKIVKTMREYMIASGIEEGDYILVHSVDHKDDSGSCGQVRQILGVDDIGNRIMVSSPWLGLKLPEEGSSTTRGFGISISFYKDWGDTICFSSLKGLHLISLTADSFVSYKTLCDYGLSTQERTVSDIEVFNNRVMVLYSNGYIQYGLEGYNSFYFTTDNVNYVGKDKIGLVSWRDVLLILGKRKIDVGVRDENRSSLITYTQTKVLGVHNKYSYGEYEGSICIISGETNPRLLAVKIVSTQGHEMLEYEDIGGYIQSRLDKVRDSDELHLSTMNNELRIYINTCSSPTMCHDNDCTRIIFFSKRFQLWYEHLTWSRIYGNLENFYFGSGIIMYTKYKENGDITTEDDYFTYTGEGPYKVREDSSDIKTYISRYINENEYNNGQLDASGGPIDLFRIIKVKSINLLLGFGRYSDSTKLSITNYRSGYGTTLVIDNLYKNKILETISHVASGDKPEENTCIDADVSDNEVMTEGCESSISLTDVERQKYVGYGVGAVDSGFDKVKINDTGLCVDRWRYNYSNEMPLHINVNETQKPSELVKIELTSENGDSLSFGGALVELNVYPLDYTGTDGEYSLTFDEDCPKTFLRDTGGCFKNLKKE